MTKEQKKTLFDNLHAEYLVECNLAKKAFRDCVTFKSVEMWARGVEHMQKADKINLMRLALM